MQSTTIPDPSPEPFFSKSFAPPMSYYLTNKTGRPALKISMFMQHPDANEPFHENYMYLTQLLHFLFSSTIIILGTLVITDAVQLNYYALSIALAAIFIVLLATFFIASWGHFTKTEFSPDHNLTVFFGFFIWVFCGGLTLVLIGVWLLQKANSTCCDFEDSQPNPDPTSNEAAQLFSIFSTIVGIQFVSTYATMKALVAHQNPEAYSVKTDTVKCLNKNGQ